MLVLEQKCNSVLKHLHEQTQGTALFHCTDGDSFEECLCENDIVQAEERALVKQQLVYKKHAKFLLRTDQPSTYKVL